MLTLISERPVLLGLLLAALLAICLMVWLRTGQRAWLIASAVFLLLIPAMIGIERAWVTSREELRATIEAVAAALERNDFDEVYRYVDSEADQAVRQARGELPNYEFSSARVTGYRDIEVDHQSTPPTATVDMTVAVVVSQRRGLMRDVRAARRVRIHLVRRDDLWKVVAYEHFPITGGTDAYSTGAENRIPTFDPGFIFAR